MILVISWLARAWLLWSTPYVPGVNGAYYLVQARALLERGRMGVPDFPLVFHLHAAVAGVIERISGCPVEIAVLWSVKGWDSLVPALVAWPVYAIARYWSAEREVSRSVPIALAAIAGMGSPWLTMVGEFQKNSLALLWLATLMWALWRWLAEPSSGRALRCLAFLGLLAFTHVGVFGTGLLWVFSMLALFTIRSGWRWWRPFVGWLIGAGALLGTAATVVARFDPARIARLAIAFSDPLRFSGDGRPMPGPPPGPLGSWIFVLGGIPFALVAIPALRRVWRQRATLPAADSALIGGAAITVLVMTGPWFSPDKLMRFYLIAVLPGLIAGSFVLLDLASSKWRRFWVVAFTALLIGPSIPRLLRPSSAVLDDAAMMELRGLASLLPSPEHSLIVTTHGCEWWTAWYLHTHIVQEFAVRPGLWEQYDAVLLLQVKSGFRGPGLLPGGPRSHTPRILPPWNVRADAETLHDGPYLRLTRLVQPPGM